MLSRPISDRKKRFWSFLEIYGKIAYFHYMAKNGVSSTKIAVLYWFFIFTWVLQEHVTGLKNEIWVVWVMFFRFLKLTGPRNGIIVWKNEAFTVQRLIFEKNLKFFEKSWFLPKINLWAVKASFLFHTQ